MSRAVERVLARLERVDNWQLFVFSVLWVVVAGLALQLIVLPYFLPFAHAGHGLIANLDSPGFHATSVELAERIRREGLTAWWFVKDGINDYVVAVSSLFYLIYPEPWILLPFNGVLFGVTVVAVRRVLTVLSGSRGVALASLLPFFMFPSFVTIWGQPHKDLNTGMGFSLVLYALVLGAFTKGKASRLASLAILAGVGMAVMWLSRPYAMSLVAAGTLSFVALALFSRQCQRGPLLAVTASVLLVTVMIEHGLDLSANTPAPAAPGAAVQSHSLAPSDEGASVSAVRWPRTRRIDPSVPPFENCLPGARGAVDGFLFNLCLVRQGYITDGKEAGASSGYDPDIRLRSAEDFIAYMPRAVAVALLEPGPQRWRTERTTLGRLATKLVPVEMIAAYVAFVLALIFGRHRLASTRVWAVMAFCVTYIVIYAIATPQIGNLYRMRAFAFAIVISTALATALPGLRNTVAPVTESLP